MNRERFTQSDPNALRCHDGSWWVGVPPNGFTAMVLQTHALRMKSRGIAYWSGDWTQTERRGGPKPAASAQVDEV
jgi:hypothetical protein